MKPYKIEIMPFGFSVSFSLQDIDYDKKILNANLLEVKKIIVAIMGPFINLLIVILLILFKIDFLHKEIVIYSNILIMLFNILPIYPLDGGRILKSLIHIFCGEKISKTMINKIAIITMIVLTFIGSIGVYYFENISIFLVIVFLWWLVICENNKEKIND